MDTKTNKECFFFKVSMVVYLLDIEKLYVRDISSIINENSRIIMTYYEIGKQLETKREKRP